MAARIFGQLVGMATVAITALGIGSGFADDAGAPLRDQLAPFLNPVPATGLLILEVVSGSNADQIGLRVGDIITHYDGQPVAQHAELSSLARVANNDRRPQVLLVIRRGDEEIEKTLPVGPIGVRLEDVTEGEERILPSAKAIDGPEPDHSTLARWLERKSHFWWIVYRGTEAVGWQHHYLAFESDRAPALRVQDYLQVGSLTRRGDRIIGFALDTHLTPRTLRLWENDKPVFDVTWKEDQIVGQRLGMPTEIAATKGTLPLELAPYLAISMARAGTRRMNVQVLMGGIEAAPLGEISLDEPSPNGETAAIVRGLGRETARMSVSADGSWRPIQYRGSFRLEPATAQQVAERFPESTAEFGPIETFPRPTTGSRLFAD